MKKPDSMKAIVEDVALFACYECEVSRHGWDWPAQSEWDSKEQHDSACVTFRARAILKRKKVKR